MSTSVPSDPKSAQPSSADAATPVISSEENFRRFWEKNSKLIYILSAAVLLAIIGKGAFEFFKNHREKSIQADYAAATSNEKLKAFAADHAGHALAGVAWLRLADEAYTEARYNDAVTFYQRAAENLANPLVGRARIGLAVAKLNAGQADDGEAHLKQLAEDQSQMKAVRAEAAYHLASHAAGTGRPDLAVKYLDLIVTVDPAGGWSQQAMGLRATLPAAAAPSSPAAPAIKLPGSP